MPLERLTPEWLRHNWGPLTSNADPLARPNTMLPIIPANNAAPEARAIPKHSVTVTKKTTMLAERSYFISLNIGFIQSKIITGWI